MDLNVYRFRSTWSLGASPHDVYDVLEDLGTYPSWWPEIRSVRQTGEDTCELRCRSMLPYDLVFTTNQERRDREAGVLQARLRGDLDGFSRWTITPSASGSVAVFEEEVEANKRALRVLAPVARPAFKANHWLMMRHGQAGLRTYLAGLQAGRDG